MTSRPALGIQESLHSRGSGAPRRRPSKPVNTLPSADLIDPALEDDRPPAHNPATEAARPPPRGRPPLFYHTVASNGIELPIHAFPYQPVASLPAPPRPGSVHLKDAAQQHRIVPGGTGVKDPPKLTAPENVPAPVQFPGGKAADVSPWTGNNAEDTLSEALVKAGISNKPQIMNETNTARPSLWSNLKNKSGINTLTTLFVAVLEKRQQSGRLRAPNTFKPPPRLTLRDSTREGWLHDLANPTASLRRLSRMIPHGLTGKVLLEQCLNKKIPLPRALWLAKCVGINELRAHKRKGQAGTVTWGRGWTSSVEQFLDSVIATMGQGNWKPRISYALHLATSLYKEHLLDDDHFLGWILNGLETCPSERLLVWLMIVTVPPYWPDITSCRRRGKRLAETLLNYLAKLYQLEDQAAFATALRYLENTLLKLIATRSACLLLPSTWTKYSALIHGLMKKRSHPQIAHAIGKLHARNERLSQSPTASSSTSQTPAARVFRKLDAVTYQSPVRIEDLSYECMEIIANATQLISILLQWASSCYREGVHRIYLATRLLRKWSHVGADIYDGVISYLRSMTWVEDGEPGILFKIVAELVRSKHFSAGRYLQWLIATGSLGHGMDLSSPNSWPVRLITEIPLTGLSDQVRNLRYTLLRGTPHSVESEAQALDSAKRSIAQAIPALFGLNRAAVSYQEVRLRGLSPTLQLEVGIWLRQQVAQHTVINEHVPTKDLAVEETASVSLISPHDFHVVRSYLEQFDDLAILADVVGIATSSLDSAVLATAADTLNYHLKAFRAIGAFDPLFGRIAMRYAAIRTVRFPERELLLSLQNLARAVQPEGQLLQLLCHDISRLDQKNSIAACSPASDNMGEVMQHAGTYSDDEIERILSSGTSMDQQMMARVLRKIVSNLQDHVVKGYSQFDNYPSWFWRLRNFDEPAFDLVLHEWSTSCLMSYQIKVLQLAVPVLVATGCMALTRLLDDLRAFIARFKGSQLVEAFPTAIDGLRILLHSKDLVQTCSPQDAYRYRVEQYKLCHEDDGRIIRGIGDVVDLVSSVPSPTSQTILTNFLSSTPILSTLKYYILSDPECLAKMKLGHSNQHPSSACFKSTLNNLLDPTGQLAMTKKGLEQQIITVFEIASELSRPICQAMIEFIFSTEISHNSDSADALSATLLGAVKTAVEEDQSTGLELLTTLDNTLSNKIRQHAEHEILLASSFLTSPLLVIDETNKTSTSLVQKYLKVIDLTSKKVNELGEPTAMLTALTERLRGITQMLSNCATHERSLAKSNGLSMPELHTWLHALLHLTVAHGPAMLLNATHAQQTAFMGVLKSLLTHQALELYPALTEHIFDVAVILSDSISDDVRIQMARVDAARLLDDARCHFILGIAAPVDGWLVLTKPVIIPSAAQTSSQPSTPVASQSQSSPIPSPQVSASVPATPQQRYFNQQQRQQMQQAQQMRSHAQFSQQSMSQNRNLPAQLQRTPSNQASPLQQMQHMQHMQGLAQQRATQPSPVQSQRPTPAAGQGAMGGPVGGAGLGKLQTTYAGQHKELMQYPFMQPRWELLADTSATSTLNETSISLSLFGARKV